MNINLIQNFTEVELRFRKVRTEIRLCPWVRYGWRRAKFSRNSSQPRRYLWTFPALNFIQIWTEVCKIRTNFHLRPISKPRVLLNQFAQNSQLFNGNVRRIHAPKVTQFGQERRKVRVEIHSLLLSRFSINSHLPESFLRAFYTSFMHSFSHSAVCLTTGPQPLLKPVLHTLRSSASSFHFQYP